MKRRETDYFIIDELGNYSLRQDWDSSIPENRIKEIKKARKVIKQFLKPNKHVNYNASSSYGLKHHIERHYNDYLSNNDCIIAMLLEGYKCREQQYQSNPHFNVSMKSIQALIKATKENQKERSSFRE